ncbi:phosphoribosylaminoimidazolesuccinocarboxamide synthase [Candidatus Saccharibacteria bacterium]|nr:phosphoribosylaminoimidazolesuccinocarboxamide synthase [Candidatus Saccharibacteria bacterium]
MWKLLSEGKVRDVYTDEEEMLVLLVATNRVPAFDEKLGVSIVGKGRMLTKISKHWFRATEMLVPNAYSGLKQLNIKTDLPSGVGKDVATKMLKLEMLPVEAIVRGYLTDDIWTAYKKGSREICGIKLPKGMQNSEEFDEPIFTPTTKASKGERDKNLTFDEMVEYFESYDIVAAYDRAQLVKEYSLKLYKYASAMLLKKGIILADTKFEFGINPLTGNIMLADEIFTPDSSHFWSLSEYTVGENQKSLDKQIIRDWMKRHPGERIPREILESTAMVYSRITDILTSTR